MPCSYFRLVCVTVVKGLRGCSPSVRSTVSADAWHSGVVVEVGEGLDQIAGVVSRIGGVTEGALGVDDVVVASAVPAAFDVSIGFEIVEDLHR